MRHFSVRTMGPIVRIWVPRNFWYVIIACVNIIPANFPHICNYTTGCLHLERYDSADITYENLAPLLPSSCES